MQAGFLEVFLQHLWIVDVEVPQCVAVKGTFMQVSVPAAAIPAISGPQLHTIVGK